MSKQKQMISRWLTDMQSQKRSQTTWKIAGTIKTLSHELFDGNEDFHINDLDQLLFI